MHISADYYTVLRFSYGLSPYNIENLEKLADFLDSDAIPPPQFNIQQYVSWDSGDEDFDAEEATGLHARFASFVQALLKVRTCGTTACAVGHAPLIEGMEPLPDEDWSAYEKRLFGVSKDDPLTQAWNFLFGPSWIGENNTAKGTAARIRYFLTHADWPEYQNPYIRNDFPWIVKEEVSA